MGAIVVVRAAFGLTASEVKPEVMCLRVKRMPGSTAVSSVEEAGQVYNLTNEFFCIPRRERQPQCRPVHRGGPAYTQRMVQLSDVHPRTVQPTERSPRAQNTDTKKSRGTRDNPVRLRHMEPAHLPLRHAAPGPPQFPGSLLWLAKEQSRRSLDFLSGQLIKTGSESIEATLRRRRILFAGFVARMEDTRLPKCVMSAELVEARAAWRARKKSGWGVSWTISEISASTPTSGRLQPRKRGNGAGRRNRGRNLSWRNGSSQRKPGLDYGMQ